MGKISVDPRTGVTYLPKEFRKEGFTGTIELISNPLALFLIKPGVTLADAEKSLEVIRQVINLRRQQGGKAKVTREGQRPKPVKYGKPQHPVFAMYTRDWLHEITGFSKGYLSRVASGKNRVTCSFIERVCYKLQMPESELFLPSASGKGE